MELIFDNTLAYGIGLAGLFLLMALLPHIHIALKYTCPLILKIGRVPPLPRVANLFSSWVLKHLVYPHRADAVLFITYLAANLTCIFVDLPTVEKAGARAGTLALINMLPLYIGPCLSFIADALHISLSAHRRIHAWAGHIVLLLTLFHGIVAAISQGNFSLEEIRNIWPFTALVSVGLLALPIWLFTKVFPYEFLLISHHFISILVTYFIWHHLPSESLFPRLYLYITLGVFLSSFILQTSITLYRSHFRFSLTRVSAEYCREIPHDDRETREIRVLTVTLYLRKPLKVEPGQYINLWTLSTPLSVFQIHPFTVTSSDKSQTKLELVIKPRQGLTRKLADLLEYGDLEYGDTTIITLFTGPHGRALPVDKVDNVLLVATGLGIIALLLYLERLIDDGRTRESCTRRVHLVWQVEDLDVVSAAEKVIDKALEKDANLGQRCGKCGKEHESLQVTICFKINEATTRKESTLKVGPSTIGGRAVTCIPPIDWHSILKEDIRRKPAGRPLFVVASISEVMKESFVSAVREYVNDVSLVYTEYQP